MSSQVKRQEMRSAITEKGLKLILPGINTLNSRCPIPVYKQLVNGSRLNRLAVK